jgi:hypothetical protein
MADSLAPDGPLLRGITGWIEWYRNLLKNRAVTIQAGKDRLELRVRLLKNTDAVREVVRRFGQVHA